jgi:hypothetical protein
VALAGGFIHPATAARKYPATKCQAIKKFKSLPDQACQWFLEARLQGNCISMVASPADAVAVTGARVDHDLPVHCRVAHCPKLAIADANLAAIASLQIHPGDMFSTEHDFEISPLGCDAVSHAILVTIAQATDIRRIECPHGMEQTLLIHPAHRFKRLLRLATLVLREVDSSRSDSDCICTCTW